MSYAVRTGLAEPEDSQVLINRLLDILQLSDYAPSAEPPAEDLETILAGVLEDAGVYKNTPAGRKAFLRFVERVNHEA